MYQKKQLRLEDNATDQLYHLHAATIFSYLRLHTFSREDAEDILVDVFMAAIEDHKFEHMEEREQVRWLWRVARNKLVDGYRRMRGRQWIPLEQIAEIVYADDAQSPEQAALRIDEEIQVRQMLQHLSVAQQEIMRLRFGQGLRSAEIASIVGKSEVAVRATLSRAMLMLRTIYKEH